MPSPPGSSAPRGASSGAVATAAVLALVILLGLVALVWNQRRGPDVTPALAQPVTAPAPTDPAARERWAAELGDDTGIPPRALVAYATAEATAAAERPSCGLSWVTLAGIGRVESNHGRFGGAQIGPDGRPTPDSTPIRGPQLDGTGGNREIRDTDGGRLDDDETYDRAVGPLQFIPETWELVGAGFDRDGERGDPDHIDDAALAAAAYLCDGASGEADRDLRRGDDWRAAVLSYNQSMPYVTRVRSEAVDYAGAAPTP